MDARRYSPLETIQQNGTTYARLFHYVTNDYAAKVISATHKIAPDHNGLEHVMEQSEVCNPSPSVRFSTIGPEQAPELVNAVAGGQNITGTPNYALEVLVPIEHLQRNPYMNELITIPTSEAVEVKVMRIWNVERTRTLTKRGRRITRVTGTPLAYVE